MNKLLLSTAAAAILAFTANSASAQTNSADLQVTLKAFEKKNCEIDGGNANGNVFETQDFDTPDQFDPEDRLIIATCNFAAEATVTAAKGIFRNDDGLTEDSGDGQTTDSGFTFAIPYEILFDIGGSNLEDDASAFTGSGQSIAIGSFANRQFILELNETKDPSTLEPFLGGSYSDVVTVSFGPPA